jgi:hypothetical protein
MNDALVARANATQPYTAHAARTLLSDRSIAARQSTSLVGESASGAGTAPAGGSFPADGEPPIARHERIWLRASSFLYQSPVLAC